MTFFVFLITGHCRGYFAIDIWDLGEIHYEIGPPRVLDPEHRTIDQHGTGVNVLFERRVALVNTQSQHRSRTNCTKWWIDIDTASCAGALGQSGGRTGALLSKKYRSGGKKFACAFFLTPTPLGP
jgi:hypothetical protein